MPPGMQKAQVDQLEMMGAGRFWFVTDITDAGEDSHNNGLTT